MRLNRLHASSATLIAVVSLYFTVAFNIAFYKKVVELNGGADWFVYSLPVLLFFLLNGVFQLLAAPLLHKVIIPLLLVIGAAISYQSLFFNIYFDKHMLTNVLITGWAESSRLMTPAYLGWIAVLGVVPALLYLMVKVDYRRWYKEIAQRAVLIVLSVLVIGGVARYFYQDYASFFRNNRDVTHLIVPTNLIVAGGSKLKTWHRARMPYMQLDLAVTQAKPDNHRHFVVLIVGETTRAQNWGLNGYARQTTPRLAKRGDEVINFHDVSSCGTSTAHSVPCMFSNMNRVGYNDARAARQDNLLDILQRAGVDISWLDNDTGCKGVCKNVAATVDLTALNLPEFCRNGECLDDILLPAFDEILNKESGKDTLVVLHTMGSHGPTYYERYTAEDRTFTPTCDTNEINRCSKEQLVNTYDNTIVYVDRFIDRVIGRLEKRDDLESAVLYVSDHGESLGENGVYLHGTPYGIATKEQTQVPMIMWFSKAFRQNEGVDFQCLADNARKNTYSHDNYFSTVFGMMDMALALSETYRQDMDILAPCRTPRPQATGKDARADRYPAAQR